LVRTAEAAWVAEVVEAEAEASKPVEAEGVVTP
jgi:hypothetical protein